MEHEQSQRVKRTQRDYRSHLSLNMLTPNQMSEKSKNQVNSLTRF